MLMSNVLDNSRLKTLPNKGKNYVNISNFNVFLPGTCYTLPHVERIGMIHVSGFLVASYIIFKVTVYTNCGVK